MTPEELARQNIDRLLAEAGWVVQDRNAVNLQAGRGVAVTELSFTTGEPDYTLFVDGKVIGTVEAKPEGYPLGGVSEQSSKYVTGLPESMPAWHDPLAFAYESTGVGTYFTNYLEPDPRSREVFSFHRPETLLEWAQEDKQLNQRLREMPPLITTGLWRAQIQAIRNLERSLAANKPRALIQMATGSGKTYTAVNLDCGLLKLPEVRSVPGSTRLWAMSAVGFGNGP
jgi:type I restriction enzyme, R subunit